MTNSRFSLTLETITIIYFEPTKANTHVEQVVIQIYKNSILNAQNISTQGEFSPCNMSQT